MVGGCIEESDATMNEGIDLKPIVRAVPISTILYGITNVLAICRFKSLRPSNLTSIDF